MLRSLSLSLSLSPLTEELEQKWRKRAPPTLAPLGAVVPAAAEGVAAAEASLEILEAEALTALSQTKLELQTRKDLRRENVEEGRRLDPRGWEGGTWEVSDEKRSQIAAQQSAP